MRNLNFQLKQLCKQNEDGSKATQADRHKVLQLCANQLHQLGHRHLGIHGLKPKHVLALVGHWKSQEVSVSTLKKRMSYLRWWANKVHKSAIIPDSNAALNIPRRVYVTNEDCGVELSKEIMIRIDDPFVKVSLMLQATFGLRREEAMKFQPAWANRGDRIVLMSSWCKGGKQREIPIRYQQQRDALDIADSLAKLTLKGSLVGKQTYVEQLHVFEYECRKAGLHGSHGLRHRYAQELYYELTGWHCPAKGGPTSDKFDDEQQKIDLEARLLISHEMGHEREDVTAIYLGR